MHIRTPVCLERIRVGVKKILKLLTAVVVDQHMAPSCRAVDDVAACRCFVLIWDYASRKIHRRVHAKRSTILVVASVS